jgi:hypothetical protein
MSHGSSLIGHDRCLNLSRRQFARTVGATALGAAALPLLHPAELLGQAQDKVGPTPKDAAESAVARLHKSLSDEQRKLISFPFDHPKRTMVNNNWAIVKPTISDMTSEQQELCREILKGITSEDGFARFQRQMEEDYGGFESYHVALFGEPGTDKPFEWVLSGRHDTLRADGNSVEGLAFGGPIFYGHASHNDTEDAQHTDNVWWYQGRQANAIFRSLDDKQKAQALVDKAYPDSPKTIRLRGDEISKQPGLEVGSLDSQHKAMVEALLKDLLLPFRACDAAEVRSCLESAGGIDRLRLTFCKEGDLGNDGVWDLWRLEGPAFAWYFRGSPHVHTWLHVAREAKNQGSLEG